MDFPFNVNSILRKEFTLVVNKDLVQSTSHHQHRGYGTKESVKHEDSQSLSKIIDAMGKASGQAQNLRGAITTSFKLKSANDHLYVLKDPDGNNYHNFKWPKKLFDSKLLTDSIKSYIDKYTAFNINNCRICVRLQDSDADKIFTSGFGSVVGIIRIGTKRLFLSDIYGQQHECQPSCVLDFYVHESKQRSGYGLKLFEHMIKHENVPPNQLAVDRPSPKFVNFLKKYYNLDKPLQQVNKFVVFPSFFDDLEAVGVVDSNRRRSAPVYRNKILDKLRPVSRNASSANSSSRKQTSKPLSNSLKELSGISPLKHVNTGQVDEETSSKLNPLNERRPPASRAQRNQLQSGTNYSRYNLRRDSGNAMTPPPLVQQKESNTQTLPRITPLSKDTRNYFINNKQTVVHGRTNLGERNITSLDNPFSSEASKLPTADNTNQANVNYTVGLLDRMNNRQTLGTSWNVFGVPNSSVQTSNPYSKIRRHQYPQ